MATSSEQLALDRWIVRRDPDVFKAIADRYAGMVYSTCCRVLGDATEAEDIAQECFEALVRTQNPPKDFLGPWLHRVATNLCLKHIRAAERRSARETAYARSLPKHTESEWDDVYRFVDEALQELPDDLHVPLVAHYFDGASHAAIAARLKVPRRTISSRITRGLDLLGDALRKRGVTASTAVLASPMGANMSRATPVPATLTYALGKLALSLSATRPLTAARGTQFLKGANTMKIAAIAVACLVVVSGVTVFLMATPSEPDTTADSVTPSSADTEEVGETTTSNTLAQAFTEFASNVDSDQQTDSATRDVRSTDLLAYILDEQDRHIEAIKSYSCGARYSISTQQRFDEVELRDIESGKKRPALGGFDRRGWWNWSDEGNLKIDWQPGKLFAERTSVGLNDMVRSVSNSQYAGHFLFQFNGQIPIRGGGQIRFHDTAPPQRPRPSAIVPFIDPVMVMYGNGASSLREMLSRENHGIDSTAAWEEGTTYRVRFQREKRREWLFEIDPSQGFAIVRFIFSSKNDELITERELDMKLALQEVKPGLWFPHSIEKRDKSGVLSATKEPYLDSTTKLYVENVVLNHDIPPERFTPAAFGPEAQGGQFFVLGADETKSTRTLVDNEFVAQENLKPPVVSDSTNQPSRYGDNELAGIVEEKSKGDSRIAKALLKPISLELDDTSLDRALEFISSYVKVEFRVDNRVPVTTNVEYVSVRNKSFHEALTSILEPLDLDYVYEPAGGYLLIRPAASPSS